MDARVDVGAELRQAREKRGLSLEQLSGLTKIKLPVLRAIEGNDGVRLPGGIYTRGFLIAYAREVGLDPLDAVRRYLAQLEPVAPPPVVVTVSPLKRMSAERLPDSPGRGFLTGIAALVLAIVAAFTTLIRLHAPASPSAAPAAVAFADGIAGTAAARPAATRPAAARSDTARPDTVRPAAGTTGSFETAGATAPAVLPSNVPGVLQLDLQTTGPCWIAATADGRRMVYRLMEAGERQTIQAREVVVLRVGDPATFRFAANGTPGRPLGRAGEAVTVRMTPDNVRDWVAR